MFSSLKLAFALTRPSCCSETLFDPEEQFIPSVSERVRFGSLWSALVCFGMRGVNVVIREGPCGSYVDVRVQPKTFNHVDMCMHGMPDRRRPSIEV